MTHDLRSRIAKALGWSLTEVGSFSLPSLQPLVRSVDPELAAEMAEVIAGRKHWTVPRGRSVGRAAGRNGHIFGFGRKQLASYLVVSSILGGGVERRWFDEPRQATEYFDEVIASGADAAKVEEYERGRYVGDVAVFMRPKRSASSGAGRARGSARTRAGRRKTSGSRK
jgi:hypothetical protein